MEVNDTFNTPGFCPIKHIIHIKMNITNTQYTSIMFISMLNILITIYLFLFYLFFIYFLFYFIVFIFIYLSRESVDGM
jgi:hypothetical protein